MVSKSERVLCCVATMLFAVAIFVYLCVNNISELTSSGVVFVAIAIIAIVSSVSYLVMVSIIRRPFPALVFCVVCWIGVYAEQPICNFLVRDLLETMGLTIWAGIIGAIILAIACLATVLTYKQNHMQKYVKLFMLVFGIVFLINTVSLTWKMINRSNAKEEGNRLIKDEFSIDYNTDTPNVFWIHPDGMLGVDAVKKYYGDDQIEFLQEMEKRGFIVNSGAMFEACHSTAVAIPVLMCPQANDTWISQKIDTHEKAMNLRQNTAFQQYMTDFRKDNETLNAFFKRGYKVDVVGPVKYYYPPEGGDYYMGFGESGVNYVTHATSGLMDVLETEDTITTLGRISVYLRVIFDFMDTHFYRPQVFNRVVKDESEQFIMDGNEKESYDMAALHEILYSRYNEPLFVVIHDSTPHCPYIYTENGDSHEASMDPIDYLPQHMYTERVIIQMVDEIIKKDPEAIIIVQSDHGLHGNTEKEFRVAFGDDADAVEMWNSTMSAVRIPEKYRNGKEKHMVATPLNISRYLVNTFVGENYEYQIEDGE